MMDEQDAMDTLTFIVVRLVTRAAKRAVEEEAAAERDGVCGHAYWCGPGGQAREDRGSPGEGPSFGGQSGPVPRVVSVSIGHTPYTVQAAGIFTR